MSDRDLIYPNKNIEGASLNNINKVHPSYNNISPHLSQRGSVAGKGDSLGQSSIKNDSKSEDVGEEEQKQHEKHHHGIINFS